MFNIKILTLLLVFLSVNSHIVIVSSSPAPEAPTIADDNNNKYNDNSYWCKQNLNAIKNRVKLFNVSPEDLVKVKNVIMFIGDGMGTTTLTATRLFKEQKMNLISGTGRLIWDEFPTVAHVKTHTANTQIGESSACATSLFSGVKANFEAVGVDDSVKFDECNSNFSKSKVSSIISWAQAYGMRTGFVTTTRVTHATPAALYAHSPNRYWEDDSKMSRFAKLNCKDIARQLVEDLPGRNMNVILGGGRRHWMPNATQVSSKSSHKKGRRMDGRNLISDWLKTKRKDSKNTQYVTNKAQMLNIDSNTDYLLGLFAESHMSFNVDRKDTEEGEPTLAEMVTTALKVLQGQGDRYFLMVEAGRIDHAHHYNNAYRALDDTLALDDAVSIILNSSLINLQDTLLIVTSDHSDSLTFSGYGTPRGSSVFGVDRQVSEISLLPYTLLTYASGPGYKSQNLNASPKDIIQRAAIPKSWGNHGGEDVPLFAVGPLSNILFTGTVDQTYIPHALAFALCISEHAERCYKSYNVYNDRLDSRLESNEINDITPESDYSEALANFETLDNLTRYLRSSVPMQFMRIRTLFLILSLLSVPSLIINIHI